MAYFDYFHGKYSEQFSFFRIPKALFTEDVFETLSTDAKLLYGVLMDRVGLSFQNGWFDQNGNIYIIFTINELIRLLHWNEKRIYSVLNELDIKKGIGLIERRRQGLGKPNIIYVKNFATCYGGIDLAEGQHPKKDADIPYVEGQELSYKDIKTSHIGRSGHPIKKGQDMPYSQSNNTDSINTELNKTKYKDGLLPVQKYGVYENVILSEAELKNLKKKYPERWKQRIDDLSAYIASSGKEYKNHYATICIWADREKKDSSTVNHNSKKSYGLPDGIGF